MGTESAAGDEKCKREKLKTFVKHINPSLSTGTQNIVKVDTQTAGNFTVMGNSCMGDRVNSLDEIPAKRKSEYGETASHEKLKTFVTYAICILQVRSFLFTHPPSTPTEVHEISMSGTGASVPPLTTHILDTSQGLPAGAVNMVLHRRNKEEVWEQLETGTTNSDGRGSFLANTNWRVGVYKLYFDTGAYFASQGTKGFYPYVEVVFQIEDPGQHYHVPLLLSPYGYSTYRGS